MDKIRTEWEVALERNREVALERNRVMSSVAAMKRQDSS
jgi:hypothetical protein